MFDVTAQRANELAMKLQTQQGRQEVGQTLYEPFKQG